MAHDIAGVFAAALTPLKKDLTPDTHAIPEYLAHLQGNGCHGALILGTTGEGTSFSCNERISIMKSAQVYKRSHPDFHLLAGTGTPNLEETTELTKLAYSFDFDGVVVLPPYYYKKIDDNSLFDWFHKLIEGVVPKDGYFIVYNIPHLTGIHISLDLLEKLKVKFPLRFAGIKDSSSDWDFARELGERFGDDLLVLSGNDSLFSTALKFNAGGCITALANLFSNLSREIWDQFNTGVSSSPTQEKLTALRKILDQYSPYPPVLKAMMNKMYGFPLSPVKPPLQDMDENQSVQAYNHFVNG